MNLCRRSVIYEINLVVKNMKVEVIHRGGRHEFMDKKFADILAKLGRVKLAEPVEPVEPVEPDSSEHQEKPKRPYTRKQKEDDVSLPKDSTEADE